MLTKHFNDKQITKKSLTLKRDADAIVVDANIVVSTLAIMSALRVVWISVSSSRTVKGPQFHDPDHNALGC